MPLAFLAMAVWVIGEMLFGARPQPPQWLGTLVLPAIYVTFAIWPIYAGWVVLSKRLTFREKGWWLFVVFWFNMLGMPWFYIFMVRRYMGIEARTGPRDEKALDSFLARCGRRRDELLAGQVDVLRSYCRTRRLRKWAAYPAVAVAGLVIYFAAVILPRQAIPMFSDMTPNRSIVVDTAKNTRTELAPDPETLRLHVQAVMMLGALFGMFGMMGFFLLGQAVFLLREPLERKVLMDFLRAADGGHAPRI
jgi:hypothetical protein